MSKEHTHQIIPTFDKSENIGVVPSAEELKDIAQAGIGEVRMLNSIPCSKMEDSKDFLNNTKNTVLTELDGFQEEMGLEDFETLGLQISLGLGIVMDAVDELRQGRHLLDKVAYIRSHLNTLLLSSVVESCAIEVDEQDKETVGDAFRPLVHQIFGKDEIDALLGGCGPEDEENKGKIPSPEVREKMLGLIKSLVELQPKSSPSRQRVEKLIQTLEKSHKAALAKESEPKVRFEEEVVMSEIDGDDSVLEKLAQKIRETTGASVTVEQLRAGIESAKANGGGLIAIPLHK